ncbi:MAG TPA: 4-hydroxy-tetrahydrodipicolinate synthase [Chthoniobacterales bacterium]
MFTGTYTALVTPFRNGRIDEDAFALLIEDQIAGGVDGIVAVGTTGESPTVDKDEHIYVVELAVRFANKRVTVIAGTGSNATSEAVHLSERAVEKGADALLLVNPYYNKPSQEGIFRHYKAIADSVPSPVMLYSIPGRTGGEIGVDTVVRLANEVPNIVSLKEAGGSVDRVSQLCAVVPESFTILSGDDSLTLPFLSVGATGVVSVASNIIPREVSDLVRAFLKGDTLTARALHRKYLSLFKDLFIEPNPVPAKSILSWLGKMSAEVRLPLCEMSAANEAKIRQTAVASGLLS